jgi:hypothetical protein
MERAEELADLSDKYLSKTLFSLVKELGPDIVSDMLDIFASVVSPTSQFMTLHASP